MRLLLLILFSINSFAADTMTRTPVYTEAGDTLSVSIEGGGASDGAILDGVNSAIKATVTGSNALKVDGSAVTQPVSAASLPLPTGAATSANQSTANTSLATIEGRTVSPIAPNSSLAKVSASVTSVVLLAANSSRKGFILFNESNSIAYIAFYPTAASSLFTVRMAPNSYYERPSSLYTGVISGIWNTANGGMAVTELLP